jgi:hypothetical protein
MAIPGLLRGQACHLAVTPSKAARALSHLIALGDALTNTGLWWVRVMGRLRADVPVATARAETETLVRQAIVAAAPAKEYDALPAFVEVDPRRVVLVTALAAAWLPSRRAARVEPMAALRCE